MSEYAPALKPLIDNPSVGGCALLSVDGEFVFGSGLLQAAASVPSPITVRRCFHSKARAAANQSAGGSGGGWGSSGAHPDGSLASSKQGVGRDGPCMDAFTSMGTRLVPFAHTGLSLYATSKYKRVCVCICRVPFGFVVTAGERPQTPQVVIAESERVLARLRA